MQLTSDIIITETEKEKEKEVVVYKDVYYKFSDILSISTEPVWYITILVLEYLSIYMFLAPNVDSQCHHATWYKYLRVQGKILYGNIKH